MVYKHMLNFWPLVPAVDIAAIYDTIKSESSKNSVDFDATFDELKAMQFFVDIHSQATKKDLNILIIGDGIGCLIKTIARMHRHEFENLNIYITYNYAETLARELLFLSLFDDTLTTMGILEKAETFLETFGNTFLRASTLAFVETKSASILESIVSSKQPFKNNSVCLNLLKQSDIDKICEALTFLKNGENTYNIAGAWEDSLRSYFGSRYDNRKNLFDYHYNMKLSQYPIINLRKYLEWCESGIAFKLRNAKYDNPNKTLCLKSLTATTKSFDIYFGDIVTSPYITFGVECGNQKLFEKSNNQYSYTSEDISKFNVIDFFKEYFSSEKKLQEKNFKVYPLFLPTFRRKKQLKNFFDAIYVTCDTTNCADNSSLVNLLKNDGIVIFETTINVVNSTKEQKGKHSEEINRQAVENDLKADSSTKYADGCFKIFVKNNEVSSK